MKSWDVKNVKIEFGMEEDGDSWIHAEIFDEKEFSIAFLNAPLSGCPLGLTAVTMEGMSMDVAKKLRDFLIYATK